MRPASIKSIAVAHDTELQTTPAAYYYLCRAHLMHFIHDAHAFCMYLRDNGTHAILLDVANKE
jgi:hypothetical protein